MIRGRSSLTWRWRWAGTAWPMSRCCVPWRSWLVRSPRARWSPGCSPRLRRRGRGRCGPSAKPGSRPGSGPGRWLARARPGSGREPDPRRHRRHDRDRALREGKGRPHLEEDVWVPSPCRVRRSWRRGRGGAAGDPAAHWERRIEHRGRAHRGDQARAGAFVNPKPACPQSTASSSTLRARSWSASTPAGPLAGWSPTTSPGLVRYVREHAATSA